MIEYLSLKRVTALHSDEIQNAVRRVVDSGWYLQGDGVATFEKQYADYIGTSHCVSCANGLDALTLIFRAYLEMGIMLPGDEVIVPANTYIASILSITENGLKPILVEPQMSTLELDETLVEAAITPRTKAILLVHLYGRCAYTPLIGTLCERHHLKLVEDNAQAHGCLFGDFGAESELREANGDDFETKKGDGSADRNRLLEASHQLHASDSRLSALDSPHRRTGSLGHAAAHSFYPGKNLGALGDAGAVTTDDKQLADVVRAIANYGSNRKYVFPYQGRNSRMDELHAAVLSVKLRYLDAENHRRKQIAGYYKEHITNEQIYIPDDPLADNVWHIFPILCDKRDELQRFLAENGVQTMIHYPIPPHKQACYRVWNDLSFPITEQIHATELSLPCNQTMTQEEVECVADAVNRFLI
ncbi:MAG: DegT/DnrJ/EryC1/StrS family aminotransferase [Prevotella sp.]|nr:DegT/DnrJ/EryC1/StrS family aminotransferase [Prevotella sp.]